MAPTDVTRMLFALTLSEVTQVTPVSALTNILETVLTATCARLANAGIMTLRLANAFLKKIALSSPADLTQLLLVLLTLCLGFKKETLSTGLEVSTRW